MTHVVEFLTELEQWGPAAIAAGKRATLEEARAYCRQLATSHYENFPVVSWLLPRRLHQHFYNVYAYCRWADDLGDEVGHSARSLELLSWWRTQLWACYEGDARHPVFVALKDTIEQFGIPPQPFEDLVSAFEQDQRVTRYETFSELRDYCRRSADPVGRIVLYLCRQYGEENARLSDSICTGLQLTNFWQDVGRDLNIGRVYLPLEDCRRFGYAVEDLEKRVTNEAFVRLMEFETARAREFLLDGLPLVERMPGRLRVDIELFARGGLRILDRIEAIGYRVWDRRPVLTKRDVAGLFGSCLLRAILRRPVARRSPNAASTENSHAVPP